MIDVINLEKHFGDNKVLRGINITIEKGDIVVVIGPSGSGKSTFLRCLNCMEDPTGGQIIFNGVDIADMKVDINVHRRHMGMVFQHFNLFNNKTVIQNIMLAPVYLACRDLRRLRRKNAWIRLTNLFRGGRAKKELLPIETDKAAIKAAAQKNALSLLKRIGLEDKADVYPSTLSGGQKQRISIARVFLKNPPIMILDEATSALDNESEFAVAKSLKELSEGRTSITIAHRLSSIKNSDRILVLTEEGIAEEGNHEELMALQGLYHEFYTMADKIK